MTKIREKKYKKNTIKEENKINLVKIEVLLEKQIKLKWSKIRLNLTEPTKTEHNKAKKKKETEENKRKQKKTQRNKKRTRIKIKQNKVKGKEN